MMTEVTNKEAALLGLLFEEPMHPYQIEKVVQFRDMRFWTDISMSSIYKVLANLERKRCVKSKVTITGSNRPQKVYSLTRVGRKALSEKVLELLSGPEHLIFRVDLGTYNIDAVDSKDIGPALDKYELKLKEYLKGYRELERFMRGEGCPENRIAIAVRPQFLIKAEIEWVKEFREKVLNRPM